MDDLPPPFGHDMSARHHVCGHCGDIYTAVRSDQRFCSDRCRLRHWRSRRRVRSAEAIGAECVRELTTEIDRLQHQVTELQDANATLREALSRSQARLISVLSRYGRRDLATGSWP
jgi:predicted nucleic acid-binding Zn ribbon protein